MRLAAAVAAFVMLGVAAGGGQRTNRTVAAREDAYRANNVGVARLEQYDFPAAAAAFRRALEIDPQLAIARLNLGIALLYGGDADNAKKEIETARAALTATPHADYLLGLIARGADKTDEAIEAFTRVRKVDPTDVGAAINLGQLYLQQRRYADAIELFRPAIAAEPFNATAAYGLATALVRSAAGDEGRVAMEKFQALRNSGYAVTFSSAYLEQGHYAEAIASTGAEPELVSEALPDVAFADATAAMMQSRVGAGKGDEAAGISLADIDNDGDLDLLHAAADGVRIHRSDQKRLGTAPAPASGQMASGVLAGDADNDGDTDLLVLRPNALALLRQEPGGKYVDVTAASGIRAGPGTPRTAAWLDADHDGDLDLLVGTSESTRLFRNDGKAVFEEVTAAAGLPVATGMAAVVPTDYDNRRDIDILALPIASAPRLYRNMRDGTFRDVAAEAGLTLDGAAVMASVADVNKDGYTDIFFARAGAPGMLALSDGRGRFRMQPADPVTADTRAAQFIDYDNDGLIDLLAATSTGLRIVRNLGSRWMDVTSRALPLTITASALASGDLDADGDTDLVLQEPGGIRVLRNDGGNRSRAIRVRLTSRVSNRSAAGTKIEMRAGSLRQRLETHAATPPPAPADIVFALGDRAGADVVRVLWPSGILQAEAAALDGSKPLNGTITIEELDRKPSSCPYLFTWNGERFEFITDFLGGGEMGYWLAPGVRNSPDPDEYVRISGERLRERNGRFELRVTNELEEALFLDRVQLVAIDHPGGTDVYPNEGLGAKPLPFQLFVTRNARPPIAASDETGRDVLDRILHMDRQYPDGFALESIRGYAAEHSLTLTLPPVSGSDPRVLLLTGWTDYSFSGDNVAAHQRGLQMVPPMLQIPDGHGGWRTVVEDIGFPVGRPQTVPVALSGRVPPDVRQVRIVTTMRVYWDEVRVASIDRSVKPAMIRLNPSSATLRWRGFSAERTPDGREPFEYDYGSVSPSSPWKVLPGRYTREGDVRDLVMRADDRFVVARPGDEVALTFEARGAALTGDKTTRTFLLYAFGYSKEMDLNSSSPDQLAPLPFRAMTSYPYAPHQAPDSKARQEYLDRYQTRIVPRALPPLELVAAGGK